MNLIWISIDSLNRHFLKTYGQPIEIDVRTPNLDALARKSTVFDAHYAGSLPCMPARREFHAGVQEFLWRPWGPMEPFDRPLVRIARQAGIVTQLVTDHFHFFQHGSQGYFSDFQGFEFIRGHEHDAWKTSPLQPDAAFLRQLNFDPLQPATDYMNPLAYARNVAGIQNEEDFFAPRVFDCAAKWLDDNHDQESFFLMIDSFDVHEPFHNPDAYANMYTDEDAHDPEMILWPVYGNVHEEGPARMTPRQVAFVRAQFAAKLTMLDRWLGRFLDRVDRYHLWDNTAVIVTSDHGHYLGEKGWMGKPDCHVYNILANTPLIIWHPEAVTNGGRVPALTSAVDLYATVLDILQLDADHGPHSRSIVPLLRKTVDRIREYALYGYYGRAVNVTDGHLTYHRAPDWDRPLYLYSSGFMNELNWFHPVEMPNPDTVESGRFLPYTPSPVWRYPVRFAPWYSDSPLFDVREDPWQETDLSASAPHHVQRMESLMRRALNELSAPEELFARLGLD